MSAEATEELRVRDKTTKKKRNRLKVMEKTAPTTEKVSAPLEVGKHPAHGEGIADPSRGLGEIPSQHMGQCKERERSKWVWKENEEVQRPIHLA